VERAGNQSVLFGLNEAGAIEAVSIFLRMDAQLKRGCLRRLLALGARSCNRSVARVYARFVRHRRALHEGQRSEARCSALRAAYDL